MNKSQLYKLFMHRYKWYVESYSDPLDWNNFNQLKYFLEYDVVLDELNINCSTVIRNPFQIYASSGQIITQAILYAARSVAEFKRIVFGEK